MTDRELMQQALHTLEGWANHGKWVWPESALEQAKRNTTESIAALRERLAQPEMQPCAGRNCGSTNPNLHSAECFEDYEKSTGMAQPEQEPVAWVYPEGLEALKSGKPWTAYGSNGDGRIPLYLNDAVAPRVEPPVAESGAGFESLPASPKWHSLTDEEIWATYFDLPCTDFERSDRIDFVRAIEAKLKERNT